MQLNDAISATLTKEGFTGNLNDMTLAWLRSVGATSDALNDAWGEYLDTQLVPAGQFNDRMEIWLKSEGAAGEQLNDLQLDYWTTRLALP